MTIQLVSGRASLQTHFSDSNIGTHNHHAVTSEYIKTLNTVKVNYTNTQ